MPLFRRYIAVNPSHLYVGMAKALEKSIFGPWKKHNFDDPKRRQHCQHQTSQSSSSSDSLESDSEGRGRGEIPFHFDYLDIDLSVSGRARGTLEYTCPGQEGTRKYWHLEAAAPHPLSLSRARPSNQRAVHSACVPGSTGSCAARRRLCLLHVDNAVAHWVARTLRARRAALCLGCDLSVHGSTV